MKIPPTSDPCWADKDFRTSTLQAIIAVYQLNSQDVADLTAQTQKTVLQWRSGRFRPIPTDTLRALMYDLKCGVKA